MDLQTLDEKIKKEASSVLFRVLLFLAYYIGLILLGIGLFAAVIAVSWFLINSLDSLRHIGGRGIVILFVLWLAMWWFCIQIAWYLVKPLFKFHKSSEEDRIEVTREDCPKLFDIIESIAESTGNKMPKHVYLSAEVNACVFYDSISIWSIFFPTPKNLMVGIGLLKGMNEDELKSVLGHEFGHFSQETMKVGSISYRLLLIIRDMIDMSEEQRKSAALTSGSIFSWDTWFHLASKPINFITGITISFYNYIEKKNRNLSRLMEFEADLVACKLVSAKPFISSFYKTDILAQRFDEYLNVLDCLISDKKSLKNFVGGYDKVFDKLSEEEHLQILNTDIILSPVGDGAKFKSKVKVFNSWDTHPSTEERIENVKQYYNESSPVNTADACELIPADIQNAVGVVKQQYIAKYMQEPVDWNTVEEIDDAEFDKWLEDLFDDRKIPSYLYPFVSRHTVNFDFPSEEELAESVESPFNDDNRNLILEFFQALNDWDVLNEMNEESTVDMEYDGVHYTDCSKAMSLHKSYLDENSPKLLSIDKQIFHYLWQKTKDKKGLYTTYNYIFTGNEGVDALSELKNSVDEIREQLAFYHANGQEATVDKECKKQIFGDFRKYLNTFDFSKMSALCGSMKFDEKETVDMFLDRCKSFVSDNSNHDTQYVFDLITDLYLLMNHLYNLGRSQWKRRAINAWRNIEEPDVASASNEELQTVEA